MLKEIYDSYEIKAKIIESESQKKEKKIKQRFEKKVRSISAE